MSIRNKMIAAFLFLILIPSTVIAYMSFYKSQAIIKDKIISYNIDILNEVSKNIEFQLYEMDQLTIILFTNPELQKSLIEINQEIKNEYRKITTKKYLEKILLESIYTRSYISSVSILSNNKDLISTTVEPLSFSNNEKKAVDATEGSLTWLGVDNQGIIKASRVIYDLQRQTKLGYMIINIKEDQLYNIYSQIKFYKKGEFYIENSRGMIISHENKAMLSMHSRYSGLIGNGNRCYSKKIAGKNDYITYHKIDGTDWKIVSIIPAVEYEREILSLKKLIILISLGCFVLSIIFAFLLSSSISKPVLKLSKMMKEVGKGNFNISSSYQSNNEIGVLSKYFNRMVQQISSLINTVWQQQLLNQKAELKSLSMQLNPHFIYNTLESINWLARINGVEDVGKMAKALGDFMRSNIGGEEFISLENELKSINNYLLIQKYRYGDKFESAINVSPEILSVNIPKFILQPIVENSIIHGIELMIGKGKIEIEGYPENDLIIINIKDNGVGIAAEKLEGLLTESKSGNNKHTGIGLKNANRRIQLYYGEQYGITITSKTGIGTSIRVVIPKSGIKNHHDNENTSSASNASPLNDIIGSTHV